MTQFWLNENLIEVSSDKTLLRFLRDDMHIKSVKDGCSEGVCGTCSVLVDGVSRRSCTLKLSKLSGKCITTVEGLSDYEKQVYVYCFSKAGAVQCGFCTPGMIISAKALLDKNNDPTEADIAKALKSNICRCTGYKNIIEAVKSAASFFRQQREVPRHETDAKILSEVFRPTAYKKVLGLGEYADDIKLPDMVYASALRSAYPRAVVEDIDISKALQHKDIITVITAEDIPGNIKAGHIVKDWDTLIAKGETTRYIGDAIVLVVSKREESLEEIKSLVDIKYKVLEPVENPEQSLSDDAPLIHPSGNILREDKIKRGEDIDKVIARSKYVVTNTYETPFTEHAYLEPECAVCRYDEDGITLYSGSQNIFDEQREIAHILGIPPEKIHVITKLVGGAFGGKEDMSVQHHAALASYLTKSTVKVKLSRQESINISTKRHAMKITMTTACDENGKLTAIKSRIVADTGAYASLGGPVSQRACTHSGGPYSFPNADIRSKAVYTNNPPGGAFRGFGVTQSCFAIENNMTLLAQKAGLSAWEIRYRNAVKPGDYLANGQLADKTTAIRQCLEEIKEIYDKNPKAGLAAALKNTGLGVGVTDTGRAIVSVEDGKVHVRTGAARVGQGLDCVALQIACQTLDISPEMVVIEAPDSNRTPNSGTTTASRQTAFTGEAITLACLKLKKEMDSGKSITKLEGEEYLGEYTCITDPITTDKEHPYSHLAYSYGVQLVSLDEQGRVSDVDAVYDIGQVINKKNAEGQIHGGIVMGLGYALTEDFPLKGCVPQAKIGTLGLLRADSMPNMSVKFVSSDELLSVAYGAKGVGEISAIPTAPAVAAAYFNRDGIMRTKLPLENTAYRKKAEDDN